jgi:RHS repeat-associated protein
MAKRLAAMYRGTLETAVDGEGSFIIAMSGSGANLMRHDPNVKSLEAAALDRGPAATAVAAAWKLGDYLYDGSGNIRKIGTEFFAYDADNRLVVSAETGQAPAVVHEQTYAHDRFGNLTAITTAGAGQTTLGVSIATNRLSTVTAAGGASVSPQYDGAGNMVGYGPATYTYDALNMMTKSVVDGVTRHYAYSPSDERIATYELTGAGTRSDWTIREQAGQVLRRLSKETSGEWQWQEDYIYRGSQMLAAEVQDTARTRHFHLDHLGTPRLITGNGGAELSRHNYYPFGVEIASPSASAAGASHEKKQFTGHERDAESLDYMHARFYAPYMGRFLSVDPVLDLKIAILTPQGWNRYSYVRNNPVRYVDPDGRADVISEVASGVFGFLPIAGDVQDGITALSGYDPITSERQTTFTRITSGIAAILPSVGGKAVAKVILAGGSALGFKALIRANFAENLAKITGGAVEGAQAHHILPQKYEQVFKNAGINIHDVKFGAWREKTDHLKNASAYNAKWAEFLKKDRTQDEILRFARDIAREYKLKINF